jgi:hypothetical protein
MSSLFVALSRGAGEGDISNASIRDSSLYGMHLRAPPPDNIRILQGAFAIRQCSHLKMIVRCRRSQFEVKSACSSSTQNLQLEQVTRFARKYDMLHISDQCRHVIKLTTSKLPPGTADEVVNVIGEKNRVLHQSNYNSS